MPAECIQHLTHRSVVGDRVCLRKDGAEMEASAGQCVQAAARLELDFCIRLGNVLNILIPVFVRLPDVDFGTRYRLTGDAANVSRDETG